MSYRVIFYLILFLKQLGFMLLPVMTGGSFSRRVLTISNTVIRCLAIFPFYINLSTLKAIYPVMCVRRVLYDQRSKYLLVFKLLVFLATSVSAFASLSSSVILNFLTLCLIFYFFNYLFDAVNSVTSNFNAICKASS